MQTTSTNNATYPFTQSDLGVGGGISIPGTTPVVAVIDESGKHYPFGLEEVKYSSSSTFVDLRPAMMYRNITELPGVWKVAFGGIEGAEGPAGPQGPAGETGPAGGVTAVILPVAPANPVDGMIWIESAE